MEVESGTQESAQQTIQSARNKVTTGSREVACERECSPLGRKRCVCTSLQCEERDYQMAQCSTTRRTAGTPSCGCQVSCYSCVATNQGRPYCQTLHCTDPLVRVAAGLLLLDFDRCWPSFSVEAMFNARRCTRSRCGSTWTVLLIIVSVLAVPVAGCQSRACFEAARCHRAEDHKCVCVRLRT